MVILTLFSEPTGEDSAEGLSTLEVDILLRGESLNDGSEIARLLGRDELCVDVIYN